MVVYVRKSSLAMKDKAKAIIKHRKQLAKAGVFRKVPKKTVSPLVRLPPEIRNKIWYFLLVSSDPINAEMFFSNASGYQTPAFGFLQGLTSGQMIHSYIPYRYFNVKNLVHGAILAVNKSIGKETTAMIYGANIFIAEDITEAMSAFATKPGRSSALIRNLVLQRYRKASHDRRIGSSNQEFGRVAKRLTGLKSLTIHGLTPFSSHDGRAIFPDAGIVRFVMSETGLRSTFAPSTNRHEYVRFAVEDAAPQSNEVTLDISLALAIHNKIKSDRRMKTMREMEINDLKSDQLIPLYVLQREQEARHLADKLRMDRERADREREDRERAIRLGGQAGMTWGGTTWLGSMGGSD